MRRLTREEARLRADFVKGQKYTLHDLRAEISASHFATAYRLIHTLKGIAGLIGENGLSDIALRIETDLRNKTTPHEHDMNALDHELNRVLNSIVESGVLDEDTLNTPPTIEEQVALFDKLQRMLSESDAACMELITEIALIPETKVLVRQVETFAFAPALVTLGVLREVLGV